jgi:hypothetical protein
LSIIEEDDVRTFLTILVTGAILFSGASALAQGKAMCGDVNDDGQFNIADLTYMIDWLFRTGPPPPDPSAAEMDLCNGTDIADADYYMNYLFRGGPAPCAGGADCTPYSGGAVSLDHVDGELSPGVITTGMPINFYLRLTNNTGTDITAATLGVRVYSPDGADWAETTADMITDPGFDLAMMEEIHGPMGDGDDTVGLLAMALTQGMPDGYDERVYRITISSLDPSHAGKTICLDSTFFSAGGNWKWSHNGMSHYIPSWSGPYCFTVQNPTPGEASVSLDHVDGFSVENNGLWAEVPISFNFRMTNFTSHSVNGFTTGFRLYSPDGATWQPAVGDTASLGWWSRFDLFFDILHHSCNGVGSDTIGFGGAVLIGPGLEDGFDAVSLLVHTQVSGDMEGKTLCVDSSLFPPSGYWLWSLASSASVYPQWDGPHCFDILGVVPGAGDSLIVPSTTVAYGDMVQPVHVKLTQPIKGASIPLKIPLDAEVDSLSRVGLLTENWDYAFSYVKPDSGFLYVALANSSGDIIPVGEHAVFNIHFHALNADCYDPFYIAWDTALSADPVRNLLFADVNGLDLEAAVDRERDRTEVPPYTPGDLDLTGGVDIADLVYMVDYMFNGGPPPFIMNTIDVNGSCTGPNIADLVYFVDYFFQGGDPPLCGCLGATTGKLPVDNSVIIGTAYDDGVTTVAISTPRPLRGLQLELIGDSKEAPINLTADRLDLLHGFDDDRLRIGLLDLDGAETIAAGRKEIIRLDGEWQIVTALAASNGREAFGLRIDNALKSVTTPTTYELHQNYPNPFNPQTSISFSLPTSCQVKLEVFNIMGQSVATLVDGFLEAGLHAVTFDGRNAASGVYFYRLSTTESKETRKMVLLK